MTTITLTDIAELRQSLADENISYGECHLIECLADEFGLVTDWDDEDGDPMPYEVVLDEVAVRLESDEIAEWLWNEDYVATHVSRGDGSDAQLVSRNPFRLRNECGYVWRDNAADWEPINE